MSAPAPLLHPGCTVLVVDDEPMFVKLAQRVLRSVACRVLSAANADEAMRAVESDQVDLVLLDVVMPDVSGPQVAERVRAARPAMPILFMSGHGRDDCLAHGLPPDAPFLAKPFEARALREQVGTLLTQTLDMLDPSA